MNTISGTKKIFIVAFGSLLLACGAYALMYRTVVRAHDELVTIHLEHDQLVAQHEQHDSMRALVEDTTATRNELMGYLLSSDDPTEFLSLMEKIANEAGVALEVQSLTREDKIENPKKGEVAREARVTAVLMVGGEWENIYHLLTLIETMPYAILVDAVNITQQTTDADYAWEGQVSISIDVQP